MSLADGVQERAIMNQTDHKSVVVVQRCTRDASLFRWNPAGLVGL